MKKVLTIGSALRDIYLDYRGSTHVEMHGRSYMMLEEGKKFEVTNLEHYVGGGAANTAVSFRKIGFDVESFFKIGTDDTGDFIIDHMAQAGVALHHVIRTPYAQTGTSFIIPSPTGNRTVLVYRGANTTLQESEIPWSIIESCDQLYVTSLSDNAAPLIVPIAAHAKKYGRCVAVNPGGSQIRNHIETLCHALKNIDIFILNASEAEQLITCMPRRAHNTKARAIKPGNTPLPQLLAQTTTPSFNLIDYFTHIHENGPTIAAVTNGAEGVYVSAHNTIYFCPSKPTTVVSSIGAGDAFGSVFVGMLLHDASIPEAAYAGVTNSRAVIGHIGAQTGQLSLEEIRHELTHEAISTISKFSLES